MPLRRTWTDPKLLVIGLSTILHCIHIIFCSGIDCEMVKSTDNIDILARVAIVTDEETLLDTFVRTDLQVLDYGTEVR